MKATLYQGDCFDYFQNIPDKSIDLVLCDPPYGTTACKWDSILPLDKMWVNLERVTKLNAAIVLFGSEPFSSKLRLSNLDSFKYDIIWKKEKPVNFFQLKNRIGKCTEIISVFYKKQCTFNPQMVKHDGPPVVTSPKSNNKSIVAGTNNKVIPKYKDTGYRYPTDILEIRRVSLGKTSHPTQKPVELLEYLIKTYSLEGETVLDFTMGSGSTGVACKNTNRNFIGIEKELDYFNIAKQRILSEGVEPENIDPVAGLFED